MVYTIYQVYNRLYKLDKLIDGWLRVAAICFALLTNIRLEFELHIETIHLRTS